MSVKIIAAVSQNGVIGSRATNSIPWSYPEDMKWFRKSTAGATVIMGRSTFESMHSKPLPKRRNIIITRSKIEDVECFETLQQALETCPKGKDYLLFESAEAEEKYKREHTIWIIGGEQIYRAGLQVADEIFLTLIPEVIDGIAGVACFPWIDPTQYELTDYITLPTGEEEYVGDGPQPSLQVAHYVRK